MLTEAAQPAEKSKSSIAALDAETYVTPVMEQFYGV